MLLLLLNYLLLMRRLLRRVNTLIPLDDRSNALGEGKLQVRSPGELAVKQLKDSKSFSHF